MSCAWGGLSAVGAVNSGDSLPVTGTIAENDVGEPGWSPVGWRNRYGSWTATPSYSGTPTGWTIWSPKASTVPARTASQPISRSEAGWAGGAGSGGTARSLVDRAVDLDAELVVLNGDVRPNGSRAAGAGRPATGSRTSHRPRGPPVAGRLGLDISGRPTGVARAAALIRMSPPGRENRPVATRSGDRRSRRRAARPVHPRSLHCRCRVASSKLQRTHIAGVGGGRGLGRSPAARTRTPATRPRGVRPVVAIRPFAASAAAPSRSQCGAERGYASPSARPG